MNGMSGVTTQGSVSLYEVLDYLYMTAPGADLTRELGRSLLAQGQAPYGLFARGPVAPVHTTIPVDRFEAALVEGVRKVVDNTNSHYGAQGIRDRFIHDGASNMLPALVAETFAEVADAKGQLDPEVVGRAFGQKAQSLIELIALGKSQANQRVSANERCKWRAFTNAEAIRKVALSMGDDGLLEKMPALKAIAAQFGSDRPLKNVRMMAIQHLFATTGPLFEQLKACGVEQCSILGKSYSSDTNVIRRLDAAGFAVAEAGSESEEVTIERLAPDGSRVRVAMSRQQYVDMWVEEQLRDLPANEKLLLLDEGAMMIKALAKLASRYPDQVSRCVAVEQTEHGLQLIADEVGEPPCPVVNIAGCWAKKEFESPMIGESVVYSIERAMLEANPKLQIEPKEAVVLGFGAVGRAVANSLRRRGYKVFVYDTDPAKLKEAEEAGFDASADRDAVLAHGHLTIGCTGRGSLDLTDLESLPANAVLANAASGKHELGNDDPHFHAGTQFGSVYNDMSRWCEFNGEQIKVGDATLSDPTRCHAVHQSASGAKRLFLNSGYVVNMSRDIPPEFIQLTRSLLLLGCIEAVARSDKVIAEPNERAQRLIVNIVREHLEQKGLSLTEPEFGRTDEELPVLPPRQRPLPFQVGSQLIYRYGIPPPAGNLLGAPGYLSSGVMVWELEALIAGCEGMFIDYKHAPEVVEVIKRYVDALATASAETREIFAKIRPDSSGDLIIARMRMELALLRTQCRGQPELMERLQIAGREIDAIDGRRAANCLRAAGNAGLLN